MSASKQNIIAIVYDFDGTLAPGNMQEPTILDHFGIHDYDAFWNQSQALVDKEGYERTLAYLKILTSDPRFKEKPFTPEILSELGAKLTYFPGVESFFDSLEHAISELPEVAKHHIRIEHYIVSSGMTEILSGCSIAKHFKKIYGCEFAYENDHPVFPKLVINDTNKTQFLFRINKGALELGQDINSHMEDNDRPIPFRNMIYIGDGYTDIPSMTVAQKNGGHAIAVYPPDQKVPAAIRSMVEEGRAEHFAPADYSHGSILFRQIFITIRKITADIAYRASAKMSLDWVQDNKKPGS